MESEIGVDVPGASDEMLHPADEQVDDVEADQEMEDPPLEGPLQHRRRGQPA